MKQLVSAVVLGALLVTPFSFAADDSLADEQAQLSYGIGATLGKSLSQDITDLDLDAFTQAVRDVYAKGDMKMSDQEIADSLSRFQQKKMEEQKKMVEQEATDNKAEGDKFLADNAKKDGVKTLDSGLQYKVLESGDGATPSAEDTVKVNYEGKLLDGTVFDSSYQRGEPVSFKVNQVIKGWQEALQEMSVGDTWMLYVPAELAYGKAGTGGPIGPNETLTFKVELLDVTKADAKQ